MQSAQHCVHQCMCIWCLIRASSGRHLNSMAVRVAWLAFWCRPTRAASSRCITCLVAVKTAEAGCIRETEPHPAEL